ncbi:HAMP domain-containing protein [Heliobacterium undosum]|uniref:HAMP domain-containing protein n=1 Tax=Heliomicrobium undosum TaxID=121734 RepID=A0A845L6N8_9FIRM|nr:methyl-accepting chemotaxis protein [Heliomicrobium undosum]MZP30330.1 HAMP domain-containing protein [Heliomicrobium undosum]
MKSIKSLLVGFTLLLTVAIFAVQTVVSFMYTKDNVDASALSRMRLQAEMEASRLESQIAITGAMSQTIANDVGALGPQHSEDLLNMTREHLKSLPMSVGAGFWLEPGVYPEKGTYFGPYLYKEGNEIKLTWDYSNAEYDYFQYDWYKNGMNSPGGAIWSEPYVDTVTGVPMLTASHPIRLAGKRIGVTTVDIGLKELTEAVRQIRVGQGGRAFIVTQQGFYLAHPDESKNLKDKILDEQDPQLQQFGKQVVEAKEVGLAHLTMNGVAQHAVFVPIGNTGMKLVAAIPEAEVNAPATRLLWTNLSIFLLAVALFALLLYLLIERRVARPLRHLKEQAERVAQGDLSVVKNEVVSQDEFGQLAQSFTTMTVNLRGIVSQVLAESKQLDESSCHLTESANQVGEAATQLAEAVGGLAEGAGKQVAEVARFRDHVQASELHVHEGEAASNALAQDARQSTAAATQCHDTIEKASQHLQGVSQSVDASTAAIRRLNGLSEEIGVITTSITGIAEQTNLLALNAAIEAARAGEHGRGFHIVADEVRKLAEESARAATQITSLVSNMQQEISGMVDMMNANVTSIGEQVGLIRQGAAALEQVIGSAMRTEGSVRQMQEAVDMISASVKAMNASAGVIEGVAGEFSALSQQLAASTQEQAAVAEEMAERSGQLSQSAQSLQEKAKQFRMDP